jgi:predicted hotdog family 3-hydroxylacyl-ACP dehydratase
MTMLERAAIEARVPHAGAMCLLDAVTRWDAAGISCSARPVGPAHPLAQEGRVGAIVAAEYAAQASALHGALLDAAASPRAGRLVKLAAIELHAERIAADDGALSVRADLLGAGPAGCLYAFEVAAARGPIAHGRLMVAFVA